MSLHCQPFVRCATSRKTSAFHGPCSPPFCISTLSRWSAPDICSHAFQASRASSIPLEAEREAQIPCTVLLQHILPFTRRTPRRGCDRCRPLPYYFAQHITSKTALFPVIVRPRTSPVSPPATGLHTDPSGTLCLVRRPPCGYTPPFAFPSFSSHPEPHPARYFRRRPQSDPSSLQGLALPDSDLIRFPTRVPRPARLLFNSTFQPSIINPHWTAVTWDCQS